MKNPGYFAQKIVTVFSLLSLYTPVRRGWLLSAIPPVAAMTLAVLAIVSPPTAAAQATWNIEQDTCSDLYPIPTPNYFNGALKVPPPAGWGDPMKDPTTGQDAHWSWDGTSAHQIVACNTLGFYATDNGSESRSYSNLVSQGYGAAFQCVELVQRYAYARWGDLPGAWANPSGSSNASNHYFNYPGHFTRQNNGTTYLPAAGDIVIFGPVDSNGNPTPNAGAGHIAIIAAVDTVKGTVKVFEQNWGTTMGFHTLHLYATPSGGSTIYTIGNDVTDSVSTFQKGPGGTTYRWTGDPVPFAHTIYGVLTDNSGSVAQSAPATPTGTSSCAAVKGQFLTSYCDAPTTTITCGGAIGSRNDFNGIPINWTFTNGNTTCDTVRYSFGYTDSRQTCSFYLYAPNGFATTTIKATLSDGSQQSFNENPVSGWQHWFDATGISSLTFTDGNGTTNQQMGWGRTATWSIERLCSL